MMDDPYKVIKENIMGYVCFEMIYKQYMHDINHIVDKLSSLLDVPKHDVRYSLYQMLSDGGELELTNDRLVVVKPFKP